MIFEISQPNQNAETSGRGAKFARVSLPLALDEKQLNIKNIGRAEEASNSLSLSSL